MAKSLKRPIRVGDRGRRWSTGLVDPEKIMLPTFGISDGRCGRERGLTEFQFTGNLSPAENNSQMAEILLLGILKIIFV